MSTLSMDAMEFAQALVDEALKAGAEQAQVLLEDREYFEIQATHEGIQLVRTNMNDSARLTVFSEQRKGEASLNGRLSADSARLVADAMQASAGGLADEANGIVESAAAAGNVHGPALPDKEVMIDALLEYMQKETDLFPKVRAGQNGVAFTILDRYFVNSNGIRQQERRGYYDFQTLFIGKDENRITSFNSAGLSTFEAPENLLESGVTRRVLSEAARSFDPKPVPGKFIGDVIITPECLGSLLFWTVYGMSGGALSGYGLLSNTSPYAGKTGEQIASRGFTMRNEPRSPQLPMGADFDDYGVPTQDIDIIQDGVLKNFVIDHYTSRKLNMPQTAGKIALTVAGGEQSLEELIAETEKGILLARYSGNYPNAQLDFSGVAKNSFYIEEGKVQYPLVETMVSSSLKEMLLQIRGISRETVNFGDGIYPYLAASGVTISSK